MPRFPRPFRLAVLLAPLALAACAHNGSVPPVYKAEAFSPDAPFQRHFDFGPLTACHLGRRALLSQGYLLEQEKSDSVRGSKSFQKGNTRQLKLDITLFCMPDTDGSTIYANALQSVYEVKSSPNSSGISVAGVGSISLPWSESKDSLVKVGEETVTDGEFYARLFDLLKGYTEKGYGEPAAPTAAAEPNTN